MILICNGMPRAGSTLQYNLARLVIEESALGEAHGYYAKDDYQHSLRLFASWRRDCRFHLVKTHDLLPIVGEAQRSEAISVCYIYRNLFDVAASLKRKFKLEDEPLLTRLDDMIAVHDELIKIPGTLVQRYEDVVAALPNAVCQIANLVGVALESEAIHRIADRCSLTSMKSELPRRTWLGRCLQDVYQRYLGRRLQLRRRLMRAGLPERFLSGLKNRVYGIDPRTLVHADHISSNDGKDGNWQEMLDETLIRIIGHRFRRWLETTGYDAATAANN